MNTFTNMKVSPLKTTYIVFHVDLCLPFVDGNSRKRPLDEVGHIGLCTACSL